MLYEINKEHWHYPRLLNARGLCSDYVVDHDDQQLPATDDAGDDAEWPGVDVVDGPSECRRRRVPMFDDVVSARRRRRSLRKGRGPRRIVVMRRAQRPRGRCRHGSRRLAPGTVDSAFYGRAASWILPPLRHPTQSAHNVDSRYFGHFFRSFWAPSKLRLQFPGFYCFDFDCQRIIGSILFTKFGWVKFGFSIQCFSRFNRI